MESGVGVEKDYRNQQPDNGSVLYGAEGSIQASKGRDEQQRWSARARWRSCSGSCGESL